jgi:cystathionine beta-lyase family protein involved in aluminum resistance
MVIKSDMKEQKKNYETENEQLKEQLKKIEDQSALYEQSVVNYFEKERRSRSISRSRSKYGNDYNNDDEDIKLPASLHNIICNTNDQA